MPQGSAHPYTNPNSVSLIAPKVGHARFRTRPSPVSYEVESQAVLGNSQALYNPHVPGGAYSMMNHHTYVTFVM